MNTLVKINRTKNSPDVVDATVQRSGSIIIYTINFRRNIVCKGTWYNWENYIEIIHQNPDNNNYGSTFISFPVIEKYSKIFQKMATDFDKQTLTVVYQNIAEPIKNNILKRRKGLSVRTDQKIKEYWRPSDKW